MNKSDSIKELAAALAKFQCEVTNPKNTAKNPQFNSKYAPLQDILALVRPILGKNGLSVLQSTTGELDGVAISTMLIHSSGEFIEMESFTLKGEQTLKGGGKVLNVQGAGSMITYIRRYQVSAILGLASEDDDDGNHGSKITPIVETEEEKNLKEIAEHNKLKIDKDKVNSINSMIEKSKSNKESFLKWAKVSKVEDITFGNFKVCADMLDKAVKEYEKKNNSLEGVI